LAVVYCEPPGGGGGRVEIGWGWSRGADLNTSDSTEKSNGQNPLDIAVCVTNALELLRGQNFENCPRSDPRATGHAKHEQNYLEFFISNRVHAPFGSGHPGLPWKPMPVLLLLSGFSVTTNGRWEAVDPPGARTFTRRLVNALLRVAQVVIDLSLTHRHPGRSYFSLCGI
jgi:hypothetical protein